MSTDTVLQAHNLGKRYGRRWAVNDLNLTVQRGDVFGFLGPNGAGKSTTIRMLLSLIQPTTGYVELFGKPLRGHRAETLSRVGGLVEAADFYLYLSGRRNLEIVARLKGNVPRGDIDRVLEIAGLAGRADDKVKTYSHGMKQRLGIAQALLGDPEFIVLDEPTTGLDPQGIKEVRELIRRLSREHGKTVFLSSHLLTETEQTATSMAIINKGVLAVQGKVNDLLSAQEMTVRVDGRPVDRAAQVAHSLSYVSKVETNDSGTLDVTVPTEMTGALTKELVAAGIEVRSLVPRRSLEEYFLKITEGASEVMPRRD